MATSRKKTPTRSLGNRTRLPIKNAIAGGTRLRLLLKTAIKRYSTWILHKLDSYPLQTFFILLSTLVLLIIVSNFIRTPQSVITEEKAPLSVDVYTVGSAPKMLLQAQIEKSGVIQITSLTGGIIQSINTKEGDTVTKGQRLLSLSSNYQGGNALTVSRQIAEAQNKLIEESYPIQKDLITKQIEIAKKTDENSDNLRTIAQQSSNDTETVLHINDEIIQTLKNNLSTLETDANPNASLILSTKQAISQFQSANLQLNSSVRNAQYQAGENNTPAQLSNIAREITLKQLELQEKSLSLNKELSSLQLRLARITEASMYPAAPFTATIERIFVRPGQSVTPGATPMTISSLEADLIARVLTTKGIANGVSSIEPSILTVNDTVVSLYPTHISNEAVQGSLYSITYALPQEYYGELTDKRYYPIQIPVGDSDTNATLPFIPLDSVYISQNDSYVFIIKDGKAQASAVKTGSVTGRFIQVISGLRESDQLILNRTVISGDPVSAKINGK